MKSLKKFFARAWIRDAAERVSATFLEAFAASFGLEGLYALSGGHINWGAVRIAEQAGLSAVIAVVKAMLAAQVKGTVSPASVAPVPAPVPPKVS